MIYIKFATIAFWLLLGGIIIYYFVNVLKMRKAHRETYEAYIGEVQRCEHTDEEKPAEVKRPPSLFHSIIMSRAFWILTFWLITTSGFMMFIVEESLQVVGFGRYALNQSKLWPEAADAANYSASFIASSDKLIDTLAIFNPLAGYVFGRYIDAEEKKLMWEMQRIEAELKKVKGRVTIIENELRIRPISPELITVSAKGRPIGPEMPPKPKMSYPKQIDYKTHAQRVEDQSEMVYITVSGTKYHKMFCRWLMKDGQLKDNILKVTREQAIRDGLTPCGTCKPR